MTTLKPLFHNSVNDFGYVCVSLKSRQQCYEQTARYNVQQYFCLTELSCHHNDTHNCGYYISICPITICVICSREINVCNMWYFEYKVDNTNIIWLGVCCQNAKTLVATCVTSYSLQCIMIYPASEKNKNINTLLSP